MTIKEEQKVRLELVYEKYVPYGSDRGTHKVMIKRDSYLEALKVMCNKLNLYFTSDDIEEEELSCEDIIEMIEEQNGDGCDYIVSLKDLISGEQIIEDEYDDYYEEDW